MNQIEGKSALIVVTGASRGFGRSVAINLARKVDKEKSLFLLTARSEEGLIETKNLLDCPNCRTALIDNEKCSEADFNDFLNLIPEKDSTFDFALIVHNAGSLGAQGKKAIDSETVSSMKNYYQVNFFSTALLQSSFSKKMKSLNVKKLFVVNVSSLLALNPLSTWSQYCSVKATRDMFFKVLAQEEKFDISVLNYAPGPLDTKMVREDILKSSETVDEVRQMFEKMQSEGNILNPDDSAEKLVMILDKGDYESGDHVDFYDR